MNTVESGYIPPGVKVGLEAREAVKNAYGLDEIDYTPPDKKTHIRPYTWDQCHSAMVYARNSEPGCDWTYLAVQEVENIFSRQRLDGFIPSMGPTPELRWWDLEPWLGFTEPKKASNYDQPPLMGEATICVHDALVRCGRLEEAEQFLRNNYPPNCLAYDHYESDRQASSVDPLVFIFHRCSSGMDSSGTFDIPFQLERSGPNTPRIVDLINVPIDVFDQVRSSFVNKMDDWDLEKARARFCYYDVMFNCKYARSRFALAEMAKTLAEYETDEKQKKLYQEDHLRYQAKAEEVEERILTRMWRPEALGGIGAFSSIKHPKGFVEEVSISNLFALELPNLPARQLRSILDLMDLGFNTKYVLPTMATFSKNYDPNNQGKGLMWRGLVWIWMNTFVSDALERQFNRPELPLELRARCANWATRIRQTSAALAPQEREHYSPITGQGFRSRNFAGVGSGYPIAREEAIYGLSRIALFGGAQ